MKNKVRYIIDQKQTTDTNRKQLFEFVLSNFGSKATLQDNYVEVEKHDEEKIVNFFTRSGFKYKKAA